MADITCILAANICRQLFFVITTAASTRWLVENFQLICYSQRVNARHNTTTVVVQDVQNGWTMGWLQWWKIAGSLYKEKEAAEKDDWGLVSITRQTPRPGHKSKAIIRLSSHPSRKSLCFDFKLVVVVIVIGLMPGFHKANYDHDNDRFQAKTKRLMWRMTTQPYNRFVFVPW